MPSEQPRRIPLTPEQQTGLKPRRIPLAKPPRTITAADVDHEAYAKAEFRRVTTPGSVPRPQEPPVSTTDRLLGTAYAGGRELASMPKALVEQASTLVVNPMNPGYGGRKLAEIGEGTIEGYKELRRDPIGFASENPVTAAGLVTAPLALRVAAAFPRPRMVAPKPTVAQPMKALPAAPPTRGGRVTADFADKPPYTYQPERPMLPDRMPRELPPGPETIIRGGTVNAEFVDRPPITGYPPQRIPLPTRNVRELPPAPSRLALPPAPVLDLPEGGIVQRGTIQGEAGGLPPMRRAEVIPTRQGVQPRYREQAESVDQLREELATMQDLNKSLSTQIDQSFAKLKGKAAPDDLKALVRQHQENRTRMLGIKQRIGGESKPTTSPTSQAVRLPLSEKPTAMEPSSGLLPAAKPIELKGGPSAPKLGTSESEAMTLAGAGRRPELLKEGKTFDDTRLVGSELFQGRGGRQRTLSEAVESSMFKPLTPYQQAVEDTTKAKLEHIRETFEISGAGDPVTGKGATRSITGTPRRIVDPNTGESIGTTGVFGGGGKRTFGLEGIQESPMEIAKAIQRDKGNPLYLRVKEAVRGMVEGTEGKDIARAVEGADEDISFNFGPETGATKLGLLRPVHNVRQAAYRMGERIGQPIVDAIGRTFDRISPTFLRRGLGTGEFAKPESYLQFRRERTGQTAALADDISGLRDQMMAALPTEESRITAARIAKNEATPEDFITAANDPNIRAMAEMVRSEFKGTAETMIREGVRQYSKLDQSSLASILSVINGERSIQSLHIDLRPFVETGIGRLYGEYLPRLYRSIEGKKVLGKYGLSQDRVRMELSRLKERNMDLSPEVRKALGEIEGIVYPATKGLFQEKQLIIDNRFFRKIANDPQLTAENARTAPRTFQQLPNVETLGPLAGKWVHPSVHRDLMQMVQAPSTVVKYLQTVNSFIKKNKTVRNPATHIRNVESNYILRDAIGGMDFSEQFLYDVKALRSYKRQGPEYQEARNAGLFGTDYASVDLSNINIDAMSPVGPNDISSAATFADRLFDAVKKVDKNAQRWYQLEDDIAKLGYYSYLRDKGNLSVKQAVDRTLQVLPDYSNVAPFVDWLRKNPVGPTFVTFASKVFPAYMRALVKHPLRAGKYLLLGEMARELSSYALNQSEAEQRKERANLPQYMRPKMGFQPFAKLPFRDEKGRELFLDLTYTLPVGDIGESTGFFGLPPEFTLGILPMTAIELGQNTNFYASSLKGSPVPIWYERTDTLIEKVRKAGLHAGAQVLPSLTPGIGYGARRLQKAIEGRANYYGEVESVKSAAANALGGQKVVAIDTKLEAEKRIREVRSELRALDEEASITKRNRGLSDKEKREVVATVQAKKMAILKRYQDRQKQ